MKDKGNKPYICGTCGLCVKDDGDPYCVMKDLYTTVTLDHACDKYDSKGIRYWVEEANG